MTDATQPDTAAALAARIAEIERRLEDWKARLPAHTVSPRMMAELDALEEALAATRQDLAEALSHSADGDSNRTRSQT